MIKKFMVTRSFSNEIERFSQKPYMKQLLISSGIPLRLNNSTGGGTVFLAVDKSTSMDCENKMNQAKEGAIGFAEEAQNKGYSVGVISFASEAKLLLEPQQEISRIKTAVEKMHPSGDTNMAEAIRMVIYKFSGIEGERIICIVTDGMPNNEKETLKAAEKAKSMGIEIMAVGTDDADQEFLEQIVTRKELSVKVEVEYFKQGITRMAELLPNKKILALKQGNNQNLFKSLSSKSNSYLIKSLEARDKKRGET